MGDLDLCRLGALLSGFGHRVTPRLDVQFVNSVLNDLAAHDMTDLGAENDFRRAVGLSEISEDRRPRSISDPAPVLPPLTPKGFTVGHDERDPFKPYVGDMTDHRNLVLACVFRRFGVIVPSAESHASSHSELASLKKKFGSAPGTGKKPKGTCGVRCGLPRKLRSSGSCNSCFGRRGCGEAGDAGISANADRPRRR